MDNVVIKKFWDSVEKTSSCWKGNISNNAPTLLITLSYKNKKTYSPRRLSLDIVGKLLPTSTHVKPLVCRNNSCVNPDHLVQGDKARFWSYINKQQNENDCWIWIGGMYQGYGSITMKKDGKKSSIRTHVYSWELFTGRPVPKGLFVCHKCDHHYCVNPQHLFLGTALDNNRDRNQKGRSSKGTKVNTCKLNEQQVRDIRKLHSEGHSTAQLSKIYNIHRSNVLHIVQKKSWKHIIDE